MNELELPEKEFESVGLTVGSIFLLRPDDAKTFVRECETRGFRILGIEGFRVHEGPKIQPIQEISTELGGFAGDTWKQTIEDLEGPFAADIWFEVVHEGWPDG
jgi:hypothetical protein